MTKLYELTEQLLWLFPDDDSDEIPADTMAKLNAVQLQWEEKVEGICKLICNLEGEAQVFKSEAARLSAHASSREKQVDYLKDYLKENMRELGITKVKTPLFPSVRVQKNSRPSIALAATIPCPSCKGSGVKPRGDEMDQCGTCLGTKTQKVTEIPAFFKRIEISLDGNKAYDAWKTGKLPAELVATVGQHLRLR